MRILVTNDDGIHADGPEGAGAHRARARPTTSGSWRRNTDQSGVAHSLSLSEPLRLRKISERHFAVRRARRPTASSWAMRADHAGSGRIWCSPASTAARNHRRGRDLFRHGRAAPWKARCWACRSIALSQAYMPRQAQCDRVDNAPSSHASGQDPCAGSWRTAFRQGVSSFNLNFPNCEAWKRSRERPLVNRAGPAHAGDRAASMTAQGRTRQSLLLDRLRAQPVQGTG